MKPTYSLFLISFDVEIAEWVLKKKNPVAIGMHCCDIIHSQLTPWGEDAVKASESWGSILCSDFFPSTYYSSALGLRFCTDVITKEEGQVSGEDSVQIYLYYQKNNSKSMVARKTISSVQSLSRVRLFATP